MMVLGQSSAAQCFMLDSEDEYSVLGKAFLSVSRRHNVVFLSCACESTSVLELNVMRSHAAATNVDLEDLQQVFVLPPMDY